MKIIRHYAITLAIFAAITTGITSLFYMLTADTIAEQATRQQEALLNQVLPSELYDNLPMQECYLITDPNLAGGKQHKLYLARKQSVPVAMAIETTAPDGYAGAIRLLIGVTIEGNVLGVRVTEHHETPGLGDKIETRLSHWIDSFKGLQLNGEQDKRWAVHKDGGMFDQFSGATITPRAVINAVKKTLEFIQQLDLSVLAHCKENS